MKTNSKKVVIIQRKMHQYRIPFFNQLKKELNNHNITLKVIYGQGSNDEQLREDQKMLSFGVFRKNFYLNNDIVWQKTFDLTSDADLVILNQANKHLYIYFYLLKKLFSNQKIAFWGHGFNRKISRTDVRNSIKKIYVNLVDWWFAYTFSVKEFLINSGFPDKQITVVNNSIDTSSFREELASIDTKFIEQLKRDYGLKKEDKIGVFCGSLYNEKKIDFLIKSSKKIKKEINNFKLIIIGSGPLKEYVDNEAKEREWLIYTGPLFNTKKVGLFKIASVYLNPGLTGLNILDAFCAGLPYITTSVPFHSPEIDYLIQNRNGIITKYDENDFVKNIINIITSKKLFEMSEHAYNSSKQYSIEQMAKNYTDGIVRCLGN